MRPAQALLPATELVRLLSSGELTPVELLDLRRKTISYYNDRLNAFITVFRDERSQPNLGAPLRGITLAVKDNIYTKGHRTTAGSRILRNYFHTYDAEVLSRLESAGSVPLGKTNLHEFAFGVTNINPHYGPCRNPWKLDRISGGSSGGSAVAVARGMACCGIGSDTAGSVRIPAALCGVVGYKPSYGLVSRRGVVPLAWSLDTMGFLTRSVEDAALLVSIASEKVPVRAPLRAGEIKGLRIGVPENMFEPLDDGVRRRFDEALATAENAGAKLVRFKFLHLKEISSCRSIIVHAEAASYHRRYFFTRYSDYGPDLRQRLAQGLAIPAVVYLDAQRVRGVLLEYYRSIFGNVEIIALPTTRMAAPTLKASKARDTAEGIRSSLLALTEPFNVFGAPAISIPCGLTGEGLPVGLQLAGDIDSDERLLSLALSFERLLPRILKNLHFGD